MPGEGQEHQRHRQLAVGQLLGACTSVVTRSSRGCGPPVGDHLVDVARRARSAPPRSSAPGCRRRSRTTPRGRRPSRATCGQWSCGSPRSRQMIRAAYGSANSCDELDPPARARTRRSARWRSPGRSAASRRSTRFLNAGTISRRIRAWSSPSRLKQRLLPPVREQPGVDAVLGRPAGVALPEPPVPQQRAHLGVPQHRPAPRGLDVPVLLAGLVHLLRRDVEAGVAEVPVPIRGARVTCRPAPSGRAAPRRARPRCRRAGTPAARRTRSRARCPASTQRYAARSPTACSNSA